MVISEIQADIERIENDASLYNETNFDNRANAIDFIDFHIIDRIDGLQQNAGPLKELDALMQHAIQVKRRLEKIDAGLFKQLRQNISTGVYAASSFSEMVCKYVGGSAWNAGRQEKAGYDNLDIFINGLLSAGPLPEATTEREPGMVFYQQTPARIIFELAEQAQLNREDVFFDIGSGLGHVAILVNLLSGATTIGTEYEPAYCNYANTCTSQLNLPDVQFVNADARYADYSRGTVFFMYTPFGGSILDDMLGVLQKESQKRNIRIFTYGPCSPHVFRQAWLECVNGEGDNVYKLYEFKSRTEGSV